MITYIEFDEQSQQAARILTSLAGELETGIEGFLRQSRERSIAKTKLEECFHWIMASINADQMARQKENEHG